MSSPQKENGFTPIANELFEAFYRCKLLEYERVCIMHIWRKTYGWNKKEDWVANSQFSEETGIPRPHITRTLKALKDKKIVTLLGNKISINKDYDKWKVEWRKLPHQVTGITSPGNDSLPHQVPTKERKKITKERGVTSSSLLNLKDKQKADMGWGNNRGDDADEFVVDYESGEVKDTAPVSKKKYPNALQVYKVFLEVLGKLPANWKVNKTQLQCAENLFAERGLDKVRNALQFYKEHQEEEFCPQVSSPYDLDTKWTKLGEFKLKLK